MKNKGQQIPNSQRYHIYTSLLNQRQVQTSGEGIHTVKLKNIASHLTDLK